jgi:protein-S-isoprenylcysteine O-methyltransferase Ste14
MKASGFEFRYRFWIILAIYGLGFWAPWDYAVHLDGAGPNAHVWGWLAALLAKAGAMDITSAFNVLLVLGIVCATAGAMLRTWGSAYLGAEVMRDVEMRGDGMVAEGPYRLMRNPLYVGSWLGTVALALLMPPSGAVFTLVVLIGFQVRLILGEEAFLRAKLGEGYVRYCAEAPRVFPKLRKPTSPVRDPFGELRAGCSTSSGQVVGHPGARARWGQAALAEVAMWGVAASFAVLGWQYNANLLLRGVLVSLGVSLVVKGASLRGPATAEKDNGGLG